MINLKMIRKAKKMSLDDMADQTGVSKSMLGQIERGDSTPTIDTIGKIVSGLRIDIDDLLMEPEVPVYQVRYKELYPTKYVEGQYKVCTCFPFMRERNFEINLIEIQPGAVYECGSHGEKTEEYIVVSEGELTLEVDDRIYQVGRLDSISFHSDTKHRYINNGREKLTFTVYFTAKRKY